MEWRHGSRHLELDGNVEFRFGLFDFTQLDEDGIRNDALDPPIFGREI